TVIAYGVALYLREKQGIFEIAVRFAFSGFAAMAPVMIAALFWKRSTKWGALASTLFVATTLIGFAMLQGKPTPPPGAPVKPATTAIQDASAVPKSGPADIQPKAPDAAKPTAAISGDLKPAAQPGAAGATAPKPKVDVIWQVGDTIILSHAPPTGDVRFWNAAGTPTGGYMTVVPMVFGSALCMIIFSLLTRPPSQRVVDKYFSRPGGN
ncbi:MAG TPA: hypothetical protein VH251_05745, partial [Verrucomicrobiae bacterium]|nr:hypothetical protein [Verrucomicrobiae bacterium]